MIDGRDTAAHTHSIYSPPTPSCPALPCQVPTGTGLALPSHWVPQTPPHPQSPFAHFSFEDIQSSGTCGRKGGQDSLLLDHTAQSRRSPAGFPFIAGFSSMLVANAGGLRLALKGKPFSSLVLALASTK